MIVVETILAFVVLIGILVFIHELGHFLAARWTGMRAEVFAVGMGPRILGYNRVTGFTFGRLAEEIELGDHTDYRISAFPIGGYVKISGMVDESMDTSFSATPPKPWEFRSKNTLQKAFVISAGVIMNFLLAVIILGGLSYFVGKEVIATTAVGMLERTGPLYTYGLREGDSILAVNGATVTHYEELAKRVYVDEVLEDVRLDLIRSGQRMTVVIPRTVLRRKPTEATIIPPKIVVEFPTVEKGRPADKAGIRPGDRVITLGGRPMRSTEEVRSFILSHKDSAVTVELSRSGELVRTVVTPGPDGLIGVSLMATPHKKVQYGLWQSLRNGVNETVNLTENIFKGIGALVTGRANLKESVAGPVMIAQAAKDRAKQGVVPFLQLMVIISVGLACMNILPVPALDGGHLVFIMVEGVIRREVPLKIRMAIQNVGFVLLLLLMAFVLYNDTSRLFGN